MNNYVIFTDSGCDIPQSMLDTWGVRACDLTFVFDGKGPEYRTGDMSPEAFYGKMREGHTVKTAAVNTETFRRAFEEVLKDGTDILYIGMSGALSSTYSAASAAADLLRPEYPARCIETVDSLSGSAGIGLLVYLSVRQKNAGADLATVAQYARDTVPHICHSFTVDDLVYLKRGGRISPVAAVAGRLLGIKPILRVNESGALEGKTKARGRRAALESMAAMYRENVCDPAERVFLTHGDCPADAEILRGLLQEKGASDVCVLPHGPTTGAHAGPGVMAIFYVGRAR